jgi:O2-independent ubiquinone biosynthesis accessory factor UbiT
VKTFVARFARRALAAPLFLAPFTVQRAVLEQGLNGALRAPLADGELDFLTGRTVMLEVPDFGWCWPITLQEGRIRVRNRDCRPDTVIRGRAAGLLAIAAGLVDPDTLFFQRRLSVEGDTELGLALKNFLDGLDPARLPLQFAVRAAGTIRRRAAAHRYSARR